MILAWELTSGAPAQAWSDLIHWRPAVVPGTVAQALALGPRDAQVAQLDTQDWFYRARFKAAPSERGKAQLTFEGLAGPAQVWLNGRLLLEARNQFRTYAVPVEIEEENELRLQFLALAPRLAARRPRPRWKTALVAQQNLRFERVSLLGRIPAWSPATPAIGPWREMRIESLSQPRLSDLRLTPAWNHACDGMTNETGATLAVRGRLVLPGGARCNSARIRVGTESYPLRIEGQEVVGELQIREVSQWWPHTHGVPVLYESELTLETTLGAVQWPTGRIGFRSVEMTAAMRLVVNGKPVFARGACWTTGGNSREVRALLETARAGGLNLIRIGGTMSYESNDFYALCDELGILVLQDFMFANLDYPVEDPEFRAEIRSEAQEQLRRLSRHPSVVVYCGGSEVHQQAAMMGLPRESWSNDFFDHELPGLCAAEHAGVPYFASSPCAAPSAPGLPFQNRGGLSHYYGVGAYRRPVSDVRHAGVKFASECLGLSNVPSAEELLAMSESRGGTLLAPHDPAWKEGVPRDRGAGYDFEDVRDHYLHELFGLNPVELRAQDPARYYDVSRAVSGEVMKRVFNHWRRPGSECGGGIVWFLRDLRAGAGWGLLDHRGEPKAAWRALARAWAPRAVLITDEGLDGLDLHVMNDASEPMRVRLELVAYLRDRVSAQASEVLEVGARAGVTRNSDHLLGYFSDLTNAYRFGPPKHDLIHVALRDVATEALIAEDFHFPLGLNFAPHAHAALTGRAIRESDGSVSLELVAQRFIQNLQISARGYRPDDDSFCLAPGARRQIRLRAVSAESVTGFKAELRALNLTETIVIWLEADSP